MVRGNHTLNAEEEAWRSAYYQDVILVDERRFLVSEALKHTEIVEAIEGTREVFIEDGKPLVDVGLVYDESCDMIWLMVLLGSGRYYEGLEGV